MVAKFAWVACGGALGAMARYGTSLLTTKWFGPRYPWGTFTVNMLGCLIMGIAFAVSRDHNLLNEQARLLVMVGFLGAFTTFSSFALDKVNLMQNESTYHMLANMAVQNILGISLVLLGIWIVKLF